MTTATSNDGSTSDDSSILDEETLNKMVEERVAEALKPIKDKLDAAYSARDEALSKFQKMEQEKREADIARMKEEGKHKEAFEAELKAAKEAQQEEIRRREAVERRNVELTRDLIVKDHLSKYTFRNEKAAKVAQGDIVATLIQNEKGEWVARDGSQIDAVVAAYAGEESNSFLFKQKSNSGTGTSGSGDGQSNKQGSLRGLSSAEIMKLAAEGKLPTQ